MLSRPYTVAIVGLGKVAHWHARSIEAIENVHLVAVCTRRPFEAETDFSLRYGAKRYTELELMYAQNEIDITIVCTPHPNHRTAVLAAARAGSHVYVEKPLAASLEDCDAMIAACKQAGVKMIVCSQRRWLPPVLRMKQAIESKKIGTPVLGTVNMLGWRDQSYYRSDPWRGKWDTEGGGVMVNQAPHQLDILLWMMGEVEQVYGVAANLNHPYIEVEDTALAIVKFKSGAIGNIVVSNSQKPGVYGKVQIHGSNGASVGVQTDGGSMFLPGASATHAPVNDLWTVPGEESLLAQFIEEDTAEFHRVDSTTYYLQRQLEDFLIQLDTGVASPALVTGEMGRRTVELFTAVYRSTQSNSVIQFPLLRQPSTHQSKWVHKGS